MALTNGMAQAAEDAITDDARWDRLTRQVSADHALVKAALAQASTPEANAAARLGTGRRPR